MTSAITRHSSLPRKFVKSSRMPRHCCSWPSAPPLLFVAVLQVIEGRLLVRGAFDDPRACVLGSEVSGERRGEEVLCPQMVRGIFASPVLCGINLVFEGFIGIGIAAGISKCGPVVVGLVV